MAATRTHHINIHGIQKVVKLTEDHSNDKVLILVILGMCLVLIILLFTSQGPPTIIEFNPNITVNVTVHPPEISTSNPAQPDITVNITTRPTAEVMSNMPNSIRYNIQAPHFSIPNAAKKLMNAGSIDDYGVLGGSSMEPTIFEGNTILDVRMTSKTELRPGMIVRYRTADTPTCKANRNNHILKNDYTVHRIISIYNDDTIITGGDHNDVIETIKKCQITHIVIGILYT